MNTISNYQSLSWYTQNSVYGARQTNQSEGVRGSQNSKEDRGNKLTETLDSLVTSGTITEDQESAIKSAIESAIQSSAYTRHKIQSSGDEAAAKVDPLSSLVAAGTITQDQADAVKSAFEESMKSRQMMPPPPPASQGDGNENPMSDILSDLVTAGTITQDQADAITSAFEESKDSQQTMPPPPPPSQADGNGSPLSDILDSLVDDGTITQEQEASISSMFQSAIKAYMTQADAAKELYSAKLSEVSL